MSEWHRDNPELVGTPADPWMQHESYRKALPFHVVAEDLEVLADVLAASADVEADSDAC